MDVLNELKREVEEMLEVDGDGYDDHFDVHAYQMGIEAVLEKIKEACNKNTSWNRVENGLPKKNGKYFVTVTWYNTEKQCQITQTDVAFFYSERDNEDCWQIPGDTRTNWFITAWQPLPSPWF